METTEIWCWRKIKKISWMDKLKVMKFLGKYKKKEEFRNSQTGKERNGLVI